MSAFNLSDAFYYRVFPIIVLLCAASGVLVYFTGSPAHALDCFIAVAFGIRLDSHIQVRRFRESEQLASLGWDRLRAPNLVN